MPYINFDQLSQLVTDDPSLPPLTWQSAALSHTGRVREINEDAFFNSMEHGLWAVADGMGGLARGDYASGVVVESLVHFIEKESLAASIRDLELRLREAHNVCRNTFHGERVGSTVAALFVDGHYGFFLWAGDSRIYRLREGALVQLTEDHTVAQEKCARGELRPKQVALHPSTHVLTRAVGVHQTLHLDLLYAPVLQGDRYLICSDGLSNELPFEQLETLLGAGSPEQALQKVFDKALDRGARDNITAIVVDAGAANIG